MVREYIIYANTRRQVMEAPSRLPGTTEVSVVIPSYNEEGNIIRLIDAISSALKGRNFEIVVVDDASKDRTQELLALRAKADSRLVAVFRKGVRGIWSAQYDGIIFSRGKTIVFMDADLSHPPKVIPSMLAHIPMYDFVSASRFISGGGIRRMPLIHYLSTNLFNRVIRIIMGVPATDYTGVFHAIKKDVLLSILPKSDSVGGAFDLDLLYYVHKKGYTFKEVPFVYIYRTEGDSKSLSMRMLAFAYGIRALRLRVTGRA